ncbi:hypothetical protein [Finegoldia magna]|uniref:Uncharacterized protein n=1 Tax=Finegoldia magna ATCC 53516 TaxID=525282 RepID=D6S7U3_FINMA|nr:hypothetical protein [Finegoldia magna]EFH94147.1 hypothetical protein HMPREF0391_10515 [Finegoldia magna ATCC 53516]
MIDFNTLRKQNWQNMTYDQRLDFYQKLENTMAASQNRPARIVTPENMPKKNIAGYYSAYDPSKIAINKRLIMQDDRRYDNCDTIIHEGRHAFQDDCIVGRANIGNIDDVNKIGDWRRNFDQYQEPNGMNSDVKYRFQPVEKDAYEYANSKFDKMTANVKDRDLYDYKHTRDIENNYYKLKAEQVYGKNYEEKIKNEINSSYEQKYGNNYKKDQGFDFLADRESRNSNIQPKANDQDKGQDIGIGQSYGL